MKDIECEVMKCGPQVPELRIGEIPPDDQVFFTQDRRVADLLAARGVALKAAI